MTPDQLDHERLVLSALAACIAGASSKVAHDHGLPVEATACSLVAAAAFLIKDAHGRDAMLTWLQGQCDGQAADPGEMKSKPN